MSFTSLTEGHPLSPEHIATLFQERHPTGQLPHFTDLFKDIQFTTRRTEEFLAFYTEIDNDFVYDKQSGLYLVAIHAKHEHLMANLYWYYTGKGAVSLYDASDAYILEGHGMFKSRAGRYIYKGASFQVPQGLQSIARDITDL
jgi:hypothetical protein